jgi:hypothetical protein
MTLSGVPARPASDALLDLLRASGVKAAEGIGSSNSPGLPRRTLSNVLVTKSGTLLTDSRTLLTA